MCIFVDLDVWCDILIGFLFGGGLGIGWGWGSGLGMGIGLVGIGFDKDECRYNKVKR